jgi:hypothetical protein
MDERRIRSLTMRNLCLAAVVALLSLFAPGVAQADVEGPEINPFECYGRWENATGSRTVGQMRAELDKLMRPMFKPTDPQTRKAIKACVIGRVKSRVGDTDAYDYLQQAIALNPEEPGFELWAGDYYSGVRGAGRPIYGKAERHFYNALEKLEALRKKKKFRPYHATVESWVQKRLLMLYQEDGLPLTPWWKGYPYAPASLAPPGVFASSQFAISKDTHDFFRNNEMRIFTAEAAFANSDLRLGGTPEPLSELDRWRIVRAPLRYQVDNRVRLRQTAIGTVDFLHSYHKAEDAQITSFYLPQELNDVTVEELGVGYQRELPLFPVMDARIRATYKRVHRKGVVEFLPEHTENFDFFEIKPSFSRFLSSDKLSLNLTYVYMGIPDLPNSAKGFGKRGMWIRGAELQYAFYSPLTLPALDLGSFNSYRSPTRGWYWWLGFVQYDQVYGLNTVTQRDLYLGNRLEGPGVWDLTLQGTVFTSDTSIYRDDYETESDDPTQAFKSMRVAAIIQNRLLNPDTMPHVQSSSLGFAPDMLNLVVPLSWDVSLDSPTNYHPNDTKDHGNDYANVRGGVELWYKMYGTGLFGSAFLFTVGYEVQYFYNIVKTMHMAHANVRLGWGDFL